MNLNPLINDNRVQAVAAAWPEIDHNEDVVNQLMTATLMALCDVQAGYECAVINKIIEPNGKLPALVQQFLEVLTIEATKGNFKRLK